MIWDTLNYLNAVVTTIYMQLCYKRKVRDIMRRQIRRAWPSLGGQGSLCWGCNMEIMLVKKRVVKRNFSGKTNMHAKALRQVELMHLKHKSKGKLVTEKLEIEARPCRPFKPFKDFILILGLIEIHFRFLWQAVTWFWYMIIYHFISSSNHTPPCMDHTGQAGCTRKIK